MTAGFIGFLVHYLQEQGNGDNEEQLLSAGSCGRGRIGTKVVRSEGIFIAELIKDRISLPGLQKNR